MLECDAFPFGAAADGLRSGCCVLFRDVTGRTEVERMKDDLISIVAHELRTPLTACRLQLDLLVKENGPQSAYAAMGEDLDHLGRIVDDWLSVARIDGGSYRVESRIVQTMPLVTRAVRLVRSRHEFRFDYDIAEEAECIRVDPSAFVELLVNLFTNACRHARPGEEPRIEFRARVDEMLVVDVCDSGTGFPEGEAEKLFDRFYQVEQGNKRRTGGSSSAARSAAPTADASRRSDLRDGPSSGSRSRCPRRPTGSDAFLSRRPPCAPQACGRIRRRCAVRAGGSRQT